MQARHGVITAEGLEQLRKRVGRVYPVEQPFVRFVNEDSIRHAAQAIGDVNPLWNDSRYGATTIHGCVIAPPALLYAVAWSSWDMRRGEGLPGVHGLHAGDRWFYFRPLRAGDEVYATKELISIEPRESSFSGRSALQVRRLEFYNQRHEHVARCDMAAIRVERDAGRERGKYQALPTGRYSPEDLARIEQGYDSEVIRGAEKRYWEDVVIGETIPGIVKGPLTVADVIAWMMGIGSPHVRTGQFWLAYRRQSPKVAVVNPDTGIPESIERVHWDDYLAREIGMPAPYDYGSQRGAWASHLFTNWCGDDGFVAELDARYRGMNFLGDTVWIRGRVEKKWIDPASGARCVECSGEGINQRGADIMPCRAVVVLPSRRSGSVTFPVALSERE